MAPSLVVPDARFERSYREAMEEFVAEGRDVELRTLPQHACFADFVDELADWSRGLRLQSGWAPESTFWLVDDEWFIGKVEIRHRLTDTLRRRGGHVGYAIRPSARRRGHGRMAMWQALGPCRDLGLHKVLVTCDVTNEASRRIIVGCGGVLEDVVRLPDREVGTMRYWIDVVAQLSSARA
jgi:predicted acetyltransferase